MQRGEQLMAFKTKSGDFLEILYLEELTAEVTVDLQNIETLVRFHTSDSLLFCMLGFVCRLQEVFEREHQYNRMKTWGLRAAGWALMFISIQLTTRILYTLGKVTLTVGLQPLQSLSASYCLFLAPAVDWVPLLRELVSFGLMIFALCLSCSLSLLVVGIGWLFYRPLVALALGALAVLPVFLARSGLQPKKNEWLSRRFKGFSAT